MITDEYLDELIKYEYMSKKLGRGPSSLIVRDMFKAKKKGRTQVENPDLLAPPSGCMDVKRWYMSLNSYDQARHRRW